MSAEVHADGLLTCLLTCMQPECNENAKSRVAAKVRAQRYVVIVAGQVSWRYRGRKVTNRGPAPSADTGEGAPAGTGAPSVTDTVLLKAGRSVVGQSMDAPYPKTGRAQVEWTFAVAGERQVWDWSGGPPPVRDLGPVRQIPRGRFRSRGVPGRVASAKTGGWVGFESGLEYSLVRRLERDRDIEWIVSQPTRLDAERRHTPDFLDVRRSGRVRLWDVRPRERRDERFEASAEMTRLACADVGWDYVIFEGLEVVEELNLLWLHCHRRQPAELERYRQSVLRDAADASTLGAMLDGPAASPGFVAAFWHLAWCGDIAFDLTQAIAPSTPIVCAGAVRE